MDVLIHAANLLRLCSFCQADVVRPRLLTAAATLVLIAYFATRTEPMLEIVAWNAFFAVVNLGQVAVELVRRRSGMRAEGVRSEGSEDL